MFDLFFFVDSLSFGVTLKKIGWQPWLPTEQVLSIDKAFNRELFPRRTNQPVARWVRQAGRDRSRAPA